MREDIAQNLALQSLEMGSIKLSPKKPFLWTSGYYMPIYNDNRRLLHHPLTRHTIAQGFISIIRRLDIQIDNIAGTATAGIPHATTLADLLAKPLSYVRSSSKGHGLQNTIEGLDASKSYHNKNVLLIEDLISTGGSSIHAVEAIRQAEGIVDYCLAIFTYNLEASKTNFDQLEPLCQVEALLNYDQLIEIAHNHRFIDDEELALLHSWKKDPFGWGETQGFAPKKKE